MVQYLENAHRIQLTTYSGRAAAHRGQFKKRGGFKYSSRMYLAVGILMLSLGACSSNPQSTPVDNANDPTGGPGGLPDSFESGVEGLVSIGPTCPAGQSGTPCPDQPFEAELTVLNMDGEPVARGKSDADGAYRIPLPPGEYVLVPEQPVPDIPPFSKPIEFEVRTGEFTALDIRYDSGVR